VIQFAKATGDLQSLSEVDLKLIALAFTLESEIHGISHLRKNPPPLQVHFRCPPFSIRMPTFSSSFFWVSIVSDNKYVPLNVFCLFEEKFNLVVKERF
jgi:hypothetical protein